MHFKACLLFMCFFIFSQGIFIDQVSASNDVVVYGDTDCGKCLSYIAELKWTLGEIGIANIQDFVINNSNYLFDQLSAQSDIDILTPQQTGQYAGIVTFAKQGVDNVKLYQYLQANNVICAYRGDGVRFSPHFHTETHSIDRALELVSRYS